MGLLQRFIGSTGMALIVGMIAVSAHAAQPPIKTGMDPNYPPHGIGRLDGGIEGFNIDFGREIARRLGRTMEIESTGFSGLVPGLQSGKYDWLIAVTGVTPERAESMLFSEPYLDNDFQFAIPKGGADIKALEDLKGKTVTVNKGSAYEGWAKNNSAKYGFKYDVYDTNTDALQAVLGGRAQALLAGDTYVKWLAKQNPRVQSSLLVKTGLQLGLAFRKNDAATRKQVSDAIKCMKQDGTMAAIYEKWMGVAPQPDSLAAKVQPGYGVAGLPGYEASSVAPKCQ